MKQKSEKGRMAGAVRKGSLATVALLAGGMCIPVMSAAGASGVQATEATQVTDKASKSTVTAATPAVSGAMVGMTAQDVGVMDRPRPAYDAKGVPLGGFRLFPTMDLSGSYDDNVFRQPSEKSDFFMTVDPKFYLRSQWGRHFLEAYAGTNSYFYSDYTDENLTDWNYGVDGRIDISRAAAFYVNTSYSEQHEPWQTPNTDVGYQAEPNRFFQIHSDARATYKVNRIGLEVGGSLDKYDYRYTPLIISDENDSTRQDNNDRDRWVYSGYGQVSYDFSPGYSGFLKATYDERDFSEFYDRTGTHRSSHGFKIDGGLQLQLTHLVSGQVFLGYISQNYSTKVEDAETDTPLKDFTGVDYGANLDWYADQRLTMHLTASRQLSDVTSGGASASDNRSVALSGDYELLRNFILQGHVTYMFSKYVGASTKYKYPSFGIGGIYMLNRYLSLEAKYDFSKRYANTSAAEYTDNLVSLTIKGHI